MFFDTYVRRFAMVSVVMSALCVLVTLLFHCGGLLGGLLLLVHGPVLLAGLLVPMTVRGLKVLIQGPGEDRPRLSGKSRLWALAAPCALVASIPLMGWLDHGGPCIR